MGRVRATPLRVLFFSMTQAKVLLVSVVMLALLGAGCTAPTGDTQTTDTAKTETSSRTVSTESSSTTTMPTFPGVLSEAEMTNKQVRISTTKGDIIVRLYPETAPMAVSNFLTLAGDGFYDNVIFHRVIDGFMIQGGDPLGTGMGGPGYRFADELNDDHEYTRGTLAMANAGANTNGSQFFIMHKDYPLPHDYTIFGYVTEGLDVVDAIATTPRDRNDRPLTPVTMNRVTVEDAAQE